MQPRTRALGLVVLFLVYTLASAGGPTRTLAAPTGQAAPATNVCRPPAAQVPSANHLGFNQIDSLAAVSPADVWAVGHYYTPTLGSTLSLIEHWDGGAWSLVPQAVLTVTNQLVSVAALGPADVWAVGSSGRPYTSPLTEHWDGNAWHVIPSPNPASPPDNASLSAVAAVAANDVWAVGSYSTTYQNFHALFLHWDGLTWTQVAAPAGLDGVSAVSGAGPNDVWAIGGGIGVGMPVFVHWDGQQWTTVPLPNLSTSVVLSAITARAANDVWAVGTDTYFRQTLVLHWDGTQWTRVPSPSVAGQATSLLGVMARAADDAWAVGQTTIPSTPQSVSTTQPVVEHWDGTAWQMVPGPVIANGSLAAVATVGSALWVGGAQDEQVTLLAQRNGASWQIAPSPNPGRAGNWLHGLAAAAPDDLWAVGTYEQSTAANNYHMTTLTQHWDGHQWTIVPDPPPGPDVYLSGSLQSAAAVTSHDVWAVGEVDDGGGGYGALIEHWDGTAWRVALTENPENRPTLFFGVAAVAAGDVWAVGTYEAEVNLPAQTRIEHWDGTAWAAVPSPNVGSGSNRLQTVAAVNAHDVWAAGWYNTDDSNARPLLLHWDGLRWASVPAPAGSLGTIAGLAARSPSNVWAVGSYFDGTRGVTRILHWDGAAWSQVASPNPGPQTNALTSVAAVAADDIWAAGYTQSGHVSQTLLVHWDGSAWSPVPSASPGGLDNGLYALAALGPHDLWAAGLHSDGAPAQTLVEHLGAFSDVNPGDYFYAPVNYLLSRNAISGYGDCTFRPGATTTRAQLSKMVVVAEGWPLVAPRQPHFADVPRDNPFYPFVETAYAHHAVSGYGDGGFHPYTAVTRGQAGKIMVAAAGWPLLTPAVPHFADVPSGSPFYVAVETAYAHGILSGYGDGTFRPANTASRAQLSKMVYLALGSPGSSKVKK